MIIFYVLKSVFVGHPLFFKKREKSRRKKLITFFPGSRLNEMNINLTWDESVVNLITLEGYNPEYGARPIKRTIRYLIEDKISDLILKEELEKKVIKLKEIDGDVELKVN